MASIYENTPIKNFYRDLWVPVVIDPSANDYLYTIPPEFNERPDLLSYRLYGSPELWWIFALRNVDILVDPIGDFKSGTVIIIPSNGAQ